MRSSIACARCRRSKVKCINNGVNTTCRACGTSGRECTYPTPLPAGGGGGGARRESYLAVASGSPQVSAEAPPVTATTAAPTSTVLGETPRRHRPKKSITSVPSHGVLSRESPRALVDALDPTVLTPKVWTELFDIFQLHFSTEFPFLHPPTFLKPLRRSSLPALQSQDFGSPNNERNASTPTPPLSPVLLLAFLALTARFHPQLVVHHSPPSASRLSSPLVAAEYYASAANARINGKSGDSLVLPDIHQVQALLMLAMHYWGACQGAKAWIAVGAAIRSAQLLGMQYEPDLDDEPLARSMTMIFEADNTGTTTTSRNSKPSGSKEDTLTEQEVRRRTFWSCFVMDRYLSNGKYRPQMLSVRDLRIQLPSSERAFLFGEKVRTLRLGEALEAVEGRAHAQGDRHASAIRESANGYRPTASSNSAFTRDARYTNGGDRDEEDEQNVRWEVTGDEGVISRFVKVTELYGIVVEWSCGGGRGREHHPPWDERSTFFSLDKRVAAFKDQLPRDLTLTPANISAHITSRTSTTYVLMHTVLSLCTVMLYRDYLPFVPLKCAWPEGPLDHSLDPPEHHVPPNYWKLSTRKLLKCARDLLKLLHTCQEWGVLVETPIIGFAVYNIALVGVYTINFPWMDLDGFMCKESANTASYDGTDGHVGAARKAVEILGQMRRRLKLADSWFKTVRRVHMHFARMKREYRSSVRPPLLAGDSSDDGFFDPQRLPAFPEDGAEGGEWRYKLLEQALKDSSTLEDEDQDMPDAPGTEFGKGTSGPDTGSDSGSATVKDEAMELAEGPSDSAAVRQEGWNAINSVAAPTATGTATNGVSAAHYVITATPQGTPAILQQQLPAASSASAAAHIYPPPQQPQPSAPAPPTQQPWNDEAKARWLRGLDVHFSGDDLAAFVDGIGCEEWAVAARLRGLGGWLSLVWGSATSAAGAM